MGGRLSSVGQHAGRGVCSPAGGCGLAIASFAVPPLRLRLRHSLAAVLVCIRGAGDTGASAWELPVCWLRAVLLAKALVKAARARALGAPQASQPAPTVALAAQDGRNAQALHSRGESGAAPSGAGMRDPSVALSSCTQ